MSVLPPAVSPSELGHGDEFVVCDDAFPDAFPAIYRFERWHQDKEVALLTNLTTGGVNLLFSAFAYTADYAGMRSPGDVVMIEMRSLYRLTDIYGRHVAARGA